jgi:hypothetical protein
MKKDIWRSLPISDPRVLLLARRLRVFTPEVVQNILLSVGGDAGTVSAGTGQSVEQLSLMFSHPFAGAAGLGTLIARRRKLVRTYTEVTGTGIALDETSIATAAGFVDLAEMQNFLARTGGVIGKDIYGAIENWHLVFSFGDIESVALHLYQIRERNKHNVSRDHPISIDLLVADFMRSYNEWLKRVYGSSIDAVSDAQLIEKKQRLIGIHRDARALKKLLEEMVARRPAKAKSKVKGEEDDDSEREPTLIELGGAKLVR